MASLPIPVVHEIEEIYGLEGVNKQDRCQCAVPDGSSCPDGGGVVPGHLQHDHDENGGPHP